jgi:signal transduction histidine kinase
MIEALPRIVTPPLRPTSVVEQELVTSIGWLISLRWLAGGSVLLGTALAGRVFGVPLPAVPLYVVGAGILVYNGLLLWAWRWLQRSKQAPVLTSERFARLQISLDWVANAALIAMSGGAESPAIIFFLFHITIASLLLPHRHGFLYVTAAPALVALVAVAEYLEWLPHVAIIQPARYQDPLFVGAVLGFFTAACYLMAYCCMALAGRLRRRETELGGLYDGLRDMTSTLEIADVLDRVVEAAARVLGCRAAAIRLIDTSRSQVEFAASFGLSDAYRDEVPAEYAKSMLDQDTLRDRVVLVPDVFADPRIWHPELVGAEGIRSMLSVAIVGRTGPMGVLRAYGEPGHRFSANDVAYLEAVAAHGAVAIEHAKAFKILADLDRDKSTFLRMTTHELRSPVRVTESLLTTLADGYVGALKREQQEVVTRAQRRLASLHALIDDLLDLAAGKADMVVAHRRAVDLGEVASEIAERFRSVADEKRLELEVERPDRPLRLWWDPADIERVVTNLVSNAVKYTKAGKVRVSVRPDGQMAMMTVQDTGIGIPSDALPHLFQEFFRASNAKAVEESGTGLGLPIVKLIVERAGGTIRVDSQEGQGTVFTLRLPLSQLVPRQSQAPGSGA